jgi:hypothetical protein
MSVNPNTGRTFTFESIKEYYYAKMSAFTRVPTAELQDPTLNLEDFVRQINEVKNYYFSLCNDSWEKIVEQQTNERQKEALWKFRDFIFAISMLWVGKVLGETLGVLKIGDNPVRDIPEKFNIKNNTFTVIGSQKLTSDIDVTIQGPGSYFIIMAVEDLFETLKRKYNIQVRCMDIEFYTDFRIAKHVYVNVQDFTPEERKEILKYAFIGYFRTTGGETISPLARTLGTKFLSLLGEGPEALDAVLSAALAEWNTMKPSPGERLNREEFYKIAKEIDNEATDIYRDYTRKKMMKAAKIEKEKLMSESPSTETKRKGSFANIVIQTQEDKTDHDKAVKIFFDIAKGDVLRPESYILPSTAIHVVDLEQLKDERGKNTSISAYFGTTPVTGVEQFTYIASAIEQLGYLEHYHSEGEICNIKGIKYVGRLIRALEKAGLLNNPELKETYTSLNALRKSGGKCTTDIPVLMDTVTTALTSSTAAAAAGGYRKKRYTKTRKHKKVTKRRHTRSRRNNGNRR